MPRTSASACLHRACHLHDSYQERPRSSAQTSHLVVPIGDPLLHARSGVFRPDAAHHFPGATPRRDRVKGCIRLNTSILDTSPLLDALESEGFSGLCLACVVGWLEHFTGLGVKYSLGREHWGWCVCRHVPSRTLGVVRVSTSSIIAMDFLWA